MNKKWAKIFTSLLAVTLLFTSCGGSNQSGKENQASDGSGGSKILRTNNSSEPGSLDPALATGTHESWILQHAFEGLMRYNAKGELEPAMAESYEVSEDGKTYTFKIKDDVKWSNGDPVTAGDFEFAWKRVCDPEVASEYSYQITTYVVGAEEFLNGKGTADDVGVKAIDDKTLEVKLKAPTPYFLGLTAFYTLLPVNQKVVTENPDWAKDPSAGNYVCNGAFKVTRWDHNSKIILEKNENYYDVANVKLDGIDLDVLEDSNTAYSKYQGGEYDLLLEPPTTVISQLMKDNNPELKIGEMVGNYYYEFNTQKKPFNNAKVRKALSMAIDRKVIVEDIAQGGQLPATGMVPKGLLDDQGNDFSESTGELVTEDPQGAKALLEEGLAEEGMTLADMNGKVILYNTDEAHKNIAQAVQEMWKKNLGIEVGLENMEFQVLIDRRREGDFDIARGGWIGDYADPNTMLDLFMTGNPQNDPKYSNPKYDELLKTAASTGDQKVRMDSMKEAEKILMEDMPIAPVYFYTQARLEKPYVSGITKTPLDYPDLTYADIDESQR